MGNEVLSINGLFPAGGKLTLFKMDTGEKIELADWMIPIKMSEYYLEKENYNACCRTKSAN